MNILNYKTYSLLLLEMPWFVGADIEIEEKIDFNSFKSRLQKLVNGEPIESLKPKAQGKVFQVPEDQLLNLRRFLNENIQFIGMFIRNYCEIGKISDVEGLKRLNEVYTIVNEKKTLNTQLPELDFNLPFKEFEKQLDEQGINNLYIRMWCLEKHRQIEKSNKPNDDDEF